MNTIIINDCRDENARGRQLARATSLIGSTVSFVGVASDLEASGNLIDALDAIGEHEGIVLVNVAPRNSRKKKRDNGTPFGYFWHKKILVVASIEGYTLSLVKKFGLTTEINVLDSTEVDSQFRSYEFLPQVAANLFMQKEVAHTKMKIEDIADPPPAVWWIDNFGNCKTTLCKEDALMLERFPYITHLKDVPDKTTAVVVGSSGLNDKRFLEIVVQGGSAAQTLGISSGNRLV